MYTHLPGVGEGIGVGTTVFCPGRGVGALFGLGVGIPLGNGVGLTKSQYGF